MPTEIKDSHLTAGVQPGRLRLNILIAAQAQHNVQKTIIYIYER